jgi:solute carrier family 25 phosphate transporter 23/24/25/41
VRLILWRLSVTSFLPGDGHLDLSELDAAMKALNLPLGSAAAELIAEADSVGDGYIGLYEFKIIMRKRQKLISELFYMLDITKDGQLTAEELREGLGAALRIDLSPAEASAMIKRISPSGGAVSYANFQRALSLFPGHTRQDLVKLWRRSAALSFMLYADGPKQQSSALILTAGCIAGAVSRSCTAPFDRLSLVLRAGNTVHHGSGLLGALSVLAVAVDAIPLFRAFFDAVRGLKLVTCLC